MKLYLTPKAPFDFDLVGSLYARFPTQCVDLYHKGIYERVLRANSQLFLAKVSSIGSAEKPKLAVEVWPDPPDDKAILSKLEWILGANDDLDGFYRLARKDRRFASVIDNLYGLRAPKTPTVYEALIIAITEQQIALPVALTMRKRLVTRYSDFLVVKGQKYYAFPTPEALAEAKPEEIRRLKFSSRKAEYLITASQKVVSGEIDLEAMRTWEKERVLATLTKIKGLGPWTVEYMMCRGMGRYDALPAGDLGLRSSLTQFLGRKERVSEAEVRNFLAPFGPHRGYAAFYLIYNYAFQKYPQEKLFNPS